MYIFQYLRHVLKLLPFQGATVPTRDTQGVASLALGYVLPWAFSPSLLNPKLQLIIMCDMARRNGTLSLYLYGQKYCFSFTIAYLCPK